MTNLCLSKVSVSLVDLLWDEVEPLLQKAVDKANGEMTTEELKEQILNGETLLYTVDDTDYIVAAVTFQKRHFDNGKEVLVILTAGGERLYEWMDDVLEEANNVGRESGCEDVYVVGRSGWKKPLGERGFQVAHTVYKKRVQQWVDQ